MNPDLQELAKLLHERGNRCAALPALLGFDGTVDHLYAVIDRRDGPGDLWTPLPDIAGFGQRITAAAGRSANLEMVPKTRKIGGNGPIMAAALAACGAPVDYLGPLGSPEIDPAFAAFSTQVRVHSIGEPAVTHALEFGDGKIMLPVLQSYDEVSAERLLESPGRNELLRLLEKARLVALLNWTCLPYMDGILDLFSKDLLPALGEDRTRRFFFDLADPAKHSASAVAGVLTRIAGFERFGQVVLGLNHSEACQAARALGLAEPSAGVKPLTECAAGLRERLGISLVMIHPRELAVAASSDEVAHVPGPVCADPVITTGAGDHLNAGFCLGLQLELPLRHCLRLGVLFSGYYVRTGRSPSIHEILDFLPDAYS